MGDVDGDGKFDLVVTNESSTTIAVLLNQGSGVFGSARTKTVGESPHALALGDLNGDGKLDVVVATLPPERGTGSVSVLLGTGRP